MSHTPVPPRVAKAIKTRNADRYGPALNALAALAVGLGTIGVMAIA